MHLRYLFDSILSPYSPSPAYHEIHPKTHIPAFPETLPSRIFADALLVVNSTVRQSSALPDVHHHSFRRQSTMLFSSRNYLRRLKLATQTCSVYPGVLQPKEVHHTSVPLVRQ